MTISISVWGNMFHICIAGSVPRGEPEGHAWDNALFLISYTNVGEWQQIYHLKLFPSSWGFFCCFFGVVFNCTTRKLLCFFFSFFSFSFLNPLLKSSGYTLPNKTVVYGCWTSCEKEELIRSAQAL